MGRLLRPAPSSATMGGSSSLPLRSQIALSTAEIAAAAIPGRPMFRTACTIRPHAVDIIIASQPVTALARCSRITAAAAGEEYVYPIPVTPPAVTSAITIVVELHSNVPSDSGLSVGTV